MNERPLGHTPGHARHDRLLVARFAAGEAISAEAEQARSLVEQCTDCARLADDMRLLRTSIAQLPTPPRTRNFRLTQAQADALRGSSLERFLRRLAAPGLTMLRPVAGVALAMGLTVAVVGAGLPMGGAAALPPAQGTDLMAVSVSPTPALSNASGGPPAAAASPGERESDSTYDAVSAPGTTPAPEPPTSAAIADAGKTEPSASEAPKFVPAPIVSTPAEPIDTRMLLIYGGVTLATFSFALLLLAWFARRRLEDPLLR